MAYFLGIDIGTGSSRGVLTDLKGTILAESSRSHGIAMPHPGWAEQDADAVWWSDFLFLTRDLLKKSKIPPSKVKGVGISTIAPCVLPVDKNGSPLRPGILYGIDSRAVEEIRELEETAGRENLFQMTGQHLSSQSVCPKILWIKKNEPDVWQKTHKILTAAGYLVYKLTGRFTLDIYNAMAFGPLYDLRRRRWDETYSQAVAGLEKFPELLWSRDIAGTVTAAAAELTGLAAGTPVATGTADAAAEAVSAGLHRDGDMMMMYGSSNFFILKTPELLPQEAFWAADFLEPGSSVLTGGMATAGSLFKWLNDTFPGRTFTQWEALAEASSPGAGGLLLLPYFAGERTPVNNPLARGVLFGLRLHTGPGDVYRAFQEALGYGIRHNIQALAQAGVTPRRILAIGGISRSRQLLQVISDITGCPQLVPRQKTGAAYGDAFLAAQGAGYFPETACVKEWVTYEEEILPAYKDKETYDRGFEKYLALYKATEPLLGME